MTARRSMVSTWQSPSIRPGQWEKGIGRLPLTSINVPTINRLKPWAQSSPVRPADQLRHWSAGRTGEDCAQGFSLFIVGTLIDVSGNRPIPFSHWPGRMDGDCHVETIERRAVIAAALDMEDQRHIAHAFGWS